MISVIVVIIVVVASFAVRIARPNKNHGCGTGRFHVIKIQSYVP